MNGVSEDCPALSTSSELVPVHLNGCIENVLYMCIPNPLINSPQSCLFVRNIFLSIHILHAHVQYVYNYAKYHIVLTLSVPYFRRHLSSAFHFLTNYCLKRSLYVNLKDFCYGVGKGPYRHPLSMVPKMFEPLKVDCILF